MACAVGMAKEGISIMELTGPGDQQDVGGKEGESRKFPGLEEYLNIQEIEKGWSSTVTLSLPLQRQ